MSIILPKKISVKEVVSSRYEVGQRPTSWDDRRSGLEVVKTEQGEVVNLYSNGGQSSPHAGWELLLIERLDHSLESEKTSSVPAYTWTLYGLKPGIESSQQAQA